MPVLTRRLKKKGRAEVKDQDETLPVQGCRLGDAKGPYLPVRKQVISKVDWPVSRSRGARELSI